MTKRIEYLVYGSDRPLQTGDWVKRIADQTKGLGAFWRVEIDSRNRLFLRNPDYPDGDRPTIRPGDSDAGRSHERHVICYASTNPGELDQNILTASENLAWYQGEMIKDSKKSKLSKSLRRGMGGGHHLQNPPYARSSIPFP